MFRNLILVLADRYHVIAPDYPGFGQSAMPDLKEFAYNFGHYADLVDDILQHLGSNVMRCTWRARWLPPGAKARRAPAHNPALYRGRAREGGGATLREDR